MGRGRQNKESKRIFDEKLQNWQNKKQSKPGLYKNHGCRMYTVRFEVMLSVLSLMFSFGF